MKTRVMQDEPDKPVVHERPADRPASGRNNLVSRIARWARSAAKAAIFGWFPPVIVAFAIGMASGTGLL
jgi:hypothetical protein